MKKTVPILRSAKFFYSEKQELVDKISTLKRMMGEHARNLDSVMATATSYNIVRLHRELDEVEYKERCVKESSSIKFKIRNHAIQAISGTADPIDALKKILNELI